MTAEQVAAVGAGVHGLPALLPALFRRPATFTHLGTYCRGLLSDLPRKSVEPIALAAGVRRPHAPGVPHRPRLGPGPDAGRDPAPHRPRAPAAARREARTRTGSAPSAGSTRPASPRRGTRRPGVQRQYCGAGGKIDNCIVTVHLACRCGQLRAPCWTTTCSCPRRPGTPTATAARPPTSPTQVIYASKWLLALDQIKRALANGVRFDWLTFDEWYGGKPEFLAAWRTWACSTSARCRPTSRASPPCPSTSSLQRPFAAKRADNAGQVVQAVQGQAVEEGQAGPQDAGRPDVGGPGRPGLPVPRRHGPPTAPTG